MIIHSIVPSALVMAGNKSIRELKEELRKVNNEIRILRHEINVMEAKCLDKIHSEYFSPYGPDSGVDRIKINWRYDRLEKLQGDKDKAIKDLSELRKQRHPQTGKQRHPKTGKQRKHKINTLT